VGVGLFRFLLIPFLFSILSVAAEKSVPPPELLVRPVTEPSPAVPAGKPSAAAITSEAETIRRPAPGPGLQLTLGPGLVVYSGKYATAAKGGSWGVSLNAGVVTEATPHSSWFVGADLGVNSWDFASVDDTVRFSAIGFQMLPTTYYRFDPLAEQWHPYVGVSLGPNLYLAKSTIAGVSGSEYTVYLELLFRPGLTFQAAKDLSLNVEPKFGFMGSAFIFQPMASANLSL
jgi:hypothetical protein